MNKNLLITIIALIIGFGGGYLVHAPAASTAPVGGTATRTGGFGGARGGTGGGFLTGTVAKTDSGSITLDTRDGSSHVVLITPATAVFKSVAGTIHDVSVGSTIMVSGATNGDGSISATNIQLRPAASSTP
ncbi:MAG TPA: hypothetical protein VNF51_00330 [Candidatus Paceibacterota bacterium]|nr:hypothetical protein [Candidatus Paceibacterota bacterium]